MTPLPAIVISGFLGAGKTTLLNRLLEHGLGQWKVGVIVNDFGKLNVDRRLIQSGEHPIREISNGCVCCTLQLGLLEAVRALAMRGGLDAVLIEASGISVSSALLHVLKSPELADSVYLSKVIAVVDARRYRVLQALPVIRDQVACATLIVLNHCDEVDATTIDAARAHLERKNPDAQIVVTEHGQVNFEKLLGDARSTTVVAQPKRHDQNWHAYEVALAEDSDADDLLKLLDHLPASVERVKGLVQRHGELHVLQKVAQFPASFECLPAGSADDSASAANTLIVIARQPIEVELRQMFPRCAVAMTAT
jgi:G3E family GTPase